MSLSLHKFAVDFYICFLRFLYIPDHATHNLHSFTAHYLHSLKKTFITQMASSSSWAQKTGFKPVFSAETKAGQSSSRQPDLEASPVVSTPSPAVNDVPHGDKVPPSPSDGVPTNNARVEERTTRLPVMVDHDDLVLRRRPSPLNYELTDSPALGNTIIIHKVVKIQVNSKLLQIYNLGHETDSIFSELLLVPS